MTAMPAHCTTCQRPLRDARTRNVTDGTVVYAGHGVCMTCRKRALRPTQCVQCGDPMRPSRTTAQEYPGTVQHAAKGQCRACYDAERSGRDSHGAITPAQHARNLAVYAGIVAERRKRGIPACGLGGMADDDPDEAPAPSRGRTPNMRRTEHRRRELVNA